MYKGIIVSSGEKSKEFAVEICSRNEKVFLPDHPLNSHSLMACSTVSIIFRRALSAFMASSREMEIRRVGKNASMPQAFRSRASLVALPESKSLGRTFSAVGDRPDHHFGIRIRQKYPVPNCLPGLQRGQGSFERICCNYNLHVELSPSGFFFRFFFSAFSAFRSRISSSCRARSSSVSGETRSEAAIFAAGLRSFRDSDLVISRAF